MGDTFTNILLHIVFSTKNRVRLIDSVLREPLYEYMGGIVRARRGVLFEIGGTRNHVHLLVRWNTGAVMDLVRDVKSDSTKWVKKTYGPNRYPGFGWQTGGGVFSVSQSQVDKVVEYIRTQETHHGRLSFEDEFLALLEEHGVSHDARQVFD